MNSLPSLKALLFELQKLPGVGPRSAQRLAEYLMKTSKKDVSALSEALADLRDRVKKCARCFNFTEDREICSICDDTTRSSEILCVVEQPFDIFKVENCGAFKGYYHVLHGVISPLNNIHPEHLTLSELKTRVERNSVKELILAIDSDLDGDTTALYILKMMQSNPIQISRLAHGIPIGGNLEYINDKTLSQAIERRSYL
ncbi:MAG: recombination mediator RecR [Bdellovibrionales bacterium]|nr:recombination mediator RecR [Bdellovibrionales bacterium]